MDRWQVGKLVVAALFRAGRELQIFPKCLLMMLASCFLSRFWFPRREVDLAVLGTNSIHLFGTCIPEISTCVGLSEFAIHETPFGLCDDFFDGISVMCRKGACILRKARCLLIMRHFSLEDIHSLSVGDVLKRFNGKWASSSCSMVL